MPPSTQRLCPVMKPDSGEAKNSTASATSLARPTRPNRVASVARGEASSGERDWIGPGVTVFTRIPWGARSMAMLRVSVSRPPLETA